METTSVPPEHMAVFLYSARLVRDHLRDALNNPSELCREELEHFTKLEQRLNDVVSTYDKEP